MTTKTTISPETARHVLWTFGRGGHRPGRFTQQLLELIAGADVQNTAKLRTAYPEETEAVLLAKYDETGIDQLRAIADGQATA